jgi:dTDP-4-amino-4,6-dideoxygalactose transaminase
MTMIPLFKPNYGQLEIDAVRQVLESGWTGRGEKVSALEKSLANFLNVAQKNLTTTTCATEGIFAIFERIGLGPGDEVLLPSISFVGMATAVRSFSAEIVWCDSDKYSLQMNIEDVYSKVTKKTRAIVINHYGGYQSCDQEFIENLQSKGIVIIEDAACAFGAVSESEPENKLGTLADFGIWSFDSMKLISMGDGGLIYAKSEEDINWIVKRNYFGLSENAKTGFGSVKIKKEKWWEFDVSFPGKRAILNDIAASIGLVQLDRIDYLLEKRRSIIDRYLQNFSGTTGISGILTQNSDVKSSPYLFWIQTKFRDELAQHLIKKEIYTSFRYYPLHLIPYFSDGKRVELPGAEYAAKATLNLPLHPNLHDAEVDLISQLVIDFVSNQEL